jgi:hypothetical protein
VIERLRPLRDDEADPLGRSMIPDEDGEYVRFADHEGVLARLRNLTADAARLTPATTETGSAVRQVWETVTSWIDNDELCEGEQ